MMAFSTFDHNNELRRRGWYAVWCYTPRVEKKTVHHWQRSRSVREWMQVLSSEAALNSTQNMGREYVVLNGGYFGYDARYEVLRQPLIGSAGNGQAGKWSHGSPPGNSEKQFQRWAFGMNGLFGGAQDFQIALMQPHPSRKGFHVPPDLEAKYSFGFSGLLCLIRNGVPMARQENGKVQLAPRGQWDSSTEFREGYYRRAAMGWTNDGKHLFLVVHHHPRSVLETRDLFAVYKGTKYSGPGPLVQKLRAEYSKLPPQEWPCLPNELPLRIENAMLLDGGHSASLMYRRFMGGSDTGARWEEHGSWVTGKVWHPDLPLVPTMIQVVER